jgi:hypothetical protein
VGQYTDKINAIAEDFATIDYYEKLSALEARDGMMIIHYNHGGKQITFNRDSTYEETSGKAGEVIIIPALDQDYINLKERDTSDTWGSRIGKWWKRVTNKKYNPNTWWIDND